MLDYSRKVSYRAVRTYVRYITEKRKKAPGRWQIALGAGRTNKDQARVEGRALSSCLSLEFVTYYYL